AAETDTEQDSGERELTLRVGPGHKLGSWPAIEEVAHAEEEHADDKGAPFSAQEPIGPFGRARGAGPPVGREERHVRQLEEKHEGGAVELEAAVEVVDAPHTPEAPHEEERPGHE